MVLAIRPEVYPPSSGRTYKTKLTTTTFTIHLAGNGRPYVAGPTARKPRQPVNGRETRWLSGKDIIMKITHITMHQGRLRFNPGPSLQRMGYKSKILKHDDGSYFSQGEALDWSNALCRELAQKRKDNSITRTNRRGQRRQATLHTVTNMFDDWFTNNPRFSKQGIDIGKRQEQPLSPATLRDYKQKARVIQNHAPLIWQSDIAALDKIIIRGMFNDIWQQAGLASANGAVRALSAALSWTLENRSSSINVNPVLGLRFPSPKKNPRFASKAEIRALIEAADSLGLPEIGDAVMLGLWTAQRQGDRLNFEHRGKINGRWHFRQSKTGAIVAVPPSPELDQRMEQSRLRRHKAKIINPRVLLSEKLWRPFNADYYRKQFARVRNKAQEKSPLLKGFCDKDLRSTAITWMGLAGVDIPQICAVSGHTLQSANNILKHYLAMHPEMADTAIAKMVTWYEQDGDVEQW